ncbi:unnamed protein product [Ostreobium quekettii]|uniref:DNA topoisomerase 6 subunit B n=1 Tax=Ostreobium quekettii TaxID=121088 RepID=A0A8S1JCF2_9CHLO|nr:unnamed protein product [Ostreobium quekettii]|eukprot:evm.model.scf_1049EXC.3 EVM.evm.TU.scf_1049EXC.3   scf_1049EXC:21549-23281(+)
MADKSTVRRKSPAEFFAENKNIAGFDNAGKCLFTSVRELVENSLDSAESISELPDVEIGIEEVSQKALNRVRGVENHERIDEALYQDFETENERKKRLAKEARDQERLAKLVANKGMDAMEVEAKRKEIEAKKLAQASKQRTYYKLTVKDNGAGMPHQDIPSLLGVVLSGTKYQVKQTRGKFGLGAKMVLIWSKMTTGLPFEIWSAQKNQKKKSHYLLDIDIHRWKATIGI